MTSALLLPPAGLPALELALALAFPAVLPAGPAERALCIPSPVSLLSANRAVGPLLALLDRRLAARKFSAKANPLQTTSGHGQDARGLSNRLHQVVALVAVIGHELLVFGLVGVVAVVLGLLAALGISSRWSWSSAAGSSRWSAA